jgi:ABC-type transport system involved in cytochrome bd biosynthesis fused ATPase/permease subunit
MILTMEEGRVVERGTHAELLLRGGRYAQLYRLHERKSGTPPPDGPSLIAAEVGG